MAATTLMKIVGLLLSFNLFLYVSGVRVVGTADANEDFINRFVNDSDTGYVTASEDAKDTIPTSFQNTGSGSGTLDFIDSLGAIKDFVIFITNIIFTPLGLFADEGLPEEVGIMIGIPLLVFGILGLAYFIRSGN